MKLIKHHWELDVYKLAMEMARNVFDITKHFPREEMYSLTDRMRRSSRSVSAQIAEAWRRRKYEAVFVNKSNEAEGEAAETQTWIEHAVNCGYLPVEQARALHRKCDRILGKLVTMGNKSSAWILQKTHDT
jgi:four helix bundle protein